MNDTFQENPIDAGQRYIRVAYLVRKSAKLRLLSDLEKEITRIMEY